MTSTRLPAFALLLACVLQIPVAAAEAQTAKWYKGNTHTHTFWSDGNDFPEMVADWYKRHGYNFLVLSDHNVLSRGERWKDVTKQDKADDVIAKARKRFGDDAVVTRQEGGKLLAKLKTLDEIRKLSEESGRFIMIEGIEITGGHQHRPVHVNAVNVSEALQPQKGTSVADALAKDATLVKEHGLKIGRPVYSHLNHPNWHYSNTAEELAKAADADAFEVINAGGGCNNTGDKLHPNTDYMWDVANAIRICRDGIKPLMGCATDDTHHYHTLGDRKANPGRGWVMVRSTELTPDAITAAMRRGDFYASTGVTLKDLRYDEKTGKLTVSVDAKSGEKYTVDFIGTLGDASLQPTKETKPVVDSKGRVWPITQQYGDDIGRTLKTVKGTKATYKLTGKELYIRAVVTNLTAPKTTWGGEDSYQRAWTQPVGWEKQVGK